MRRASVLLLALLGAAGCEVERLRLIAAPPDDVELVAVLFFDASGALAGSTPLLTHQVAINGYYHREPSGLTRAIMLGWPSSALGANPPDADTIARARLRIAGESEPRLPDPIWMAEGEISDGRSTLAERARPLELELTAEWLPRCPAIATPLDDPPFLDVRCADTIQPTSVTQNECGLTIDLRASGFSITTGTLDGRGRFTAMPGQCAVVETVPEAAISLSCEDCPVDLYTANQPARFTLAEKKIEVFPGVPLHDGDQDAGYVTDLVLLPARGELAVITHGGRATSPRFCTGDPTGLYFFDQETMVRTATAATPMCLMKLAADGDHLIGLVGGPAPELVRFDARGRILARSSLADPRLDTTHRAFPMVLAGDRIVVGWSGIGTRLGGYAAIYDRVTFALRGMALIEHPMLDEFEEGVRILDMVPAGEDLIAVATEPDERVYMIAVEAAVPSGWDRMAMSREVSRRPHQISYAADRGLLVVVSPNYHPVVHIASAENAMWRDAAALYELLGNPRAAAPLPLRPGQALVAVDGGPLASTSLAIFDYARVRFLPGAQEIAPGRPLAVEIDAAGRAWVLIHQTATIMRVDQIE